MSETNDTATLSPELLDELKAAMGANDSAEAGFEALGRELGAAATGEDPEERGRVAFQRRLDDIRAAVCGSQKVRNYCMDNNYADATTVAALVAGTLIAGHFSGLNVILVACICARLGLRNLCQREWATMHERE